MPVCESVGSGKETEASEWLIRVVDKPDPNPLWVLIWGGSADLAQALWTVQQTRTSEELAAFLTKLRIHAVGDQDATGPWIKQTFPDLFYITRQNGIRGMYRGGDMSLVSSEWVETHIHNGHGALGALYPNYHGGDIYMRIYGGVYGVKEGDTPTYLSLIPNGLNFPDWPQLGGWGGCFAPDQQATVPTQWTDTLDGYPGDNDDPDPRMSTIYCWRPAFQADLQARLDWCVQSYAEANHAPIPQLKHANLTVKPGDHVQLDASASYDPDGDQLSFSWQVYPAADFPITIIGEQEASAEFIVPHIEKSTTLRLLVTVKDNGSPSLTSYGSVLVHIEPA